MPTSGSHRIHFGRHAVLFRSDPAVWGCIAIVLGIQWLMGQAGGAAGQERWYVTFGLSRSEFLSGKYWQLMSYAWLHGGWWHVGLNALMLLVVGARIERMLGGRALVRGLLAGMLGGGLGHLCLGSGILVGLSGGCMALLLMMTTLSPESQMWPIRISGRSLGMGLMLTACLFVLMDPALGLPWSRVTGRWLTGHGMGAWMQIGHACHLGGGLAGWLHARWWLRSRVTLEDLRRDRARRERA